MNRIISSYGFYYPVQWLRGEPIVRAEKVMVSYSKMDKAERETYRKRALECLLNHLWRSSYYRKVFVDLGIAESSLVTDEVFEQLPLLDKSTLRDKEEELAVKNLRASWRKTSGSTGTPLLFRKDRWATAMMDALMYQRYSWYGVQKGDREARLWGRALGGRKLFFHKMVDIGMNRRRLSSFDMSTSSVNEYVGVLERFQPRWVYAYPNALARLLDLASNRSLARLRDLPLKAVICTGEILTRSNRDRFKNFFRAPVVNEYGSTENGIIAFQCKKGRLHISVENLVVEVMDEQGVLRRCGSGKIVITELHSRSIPFVRYELGDQVIIDDTYQCACGREGPILQSLEGRIDSFISLPSGRKIYDAILAYALGGRVKQFRGIQTSIDSLRVEVIPHDGNSECDVQRMVTSALRSQLEEEMNLDVVLVGRIDPDPAGKLRYFVPLKEGAR